MSNVPSFLPPATRALCLGLATLAGGAHAAGQVTVVHAPVTAIALGPTSASVAINPARPGRPLNSTGVIGAPVTAISGVPFMPAHIVIR